MNVTPRFQIGISKPEIGDEEKQAVLEVLESGMLVQGDKVKLFEEDFAEFCGVKHAVATSNGTTALTIALMAHDIKAGDEVIIPSFTFMATATSVMAIGAHPIFVDIEPDTFSIAVKEIENSITKKTTAIIPVHLYGHPALIEDIRDLCKKYNLALIEDAAQAHGAKAAGQFVGSFGTGCFSFYPSKNMMTGEGGMLTTNDDTIAKQARMIRNHGMSEQYLHEVLGLNYRMTNIAAAIGIVQLKKLSAWNEQRIKNARYLSQHISRVKTPAVRKDCVHVFHQYTVIIPQDLNRDEILSKLNDKGIGARIYYPTPIHKQPIIRKMYPDIQSLPITESLTQSVMSLPVHPKLTQDELDYIVEQVNAL